MPEVFENFFNCFGKKTSDYYNLVQLDPGFRLYFGKGETLDIAADKGKLKADFEQIEPGSGAQLDKFLADAEFKYRIGMLKLAHKPSVSWLEFAEPSIVLNAAKLNMFTPVSTVVRRYFKDPRLIALMEFPALFLGAMPWQIPSLYTLMNYAALEGGTWYPMGGMYKIVEAMEALARSLEVNILTDAAVTQIKVDNRRVTGIQTAAGEHSADAVIGACDYHHLEQCLLPPADRNYRDSYWEKKTFAPSCLLFYIGLDKKLSNVLHHNLFFDTDLAKHAAEIYTAPAWPTAPLFYVCVPSVTDHSVAPAGCENLFVLMPIATGLNNGDDKHEFYFDLLLTRMEQMTGESIRPHVIYKRAYCIDNFKADYNAYKGNAYGLANTLRQTAVLKPSVKNKKLKNLFYAGQLTVPGPGLPPGIISGQIASTLTDQYLKQVKHETII